MAQTKKITAKQNFEAGSLRMYRGEEKTVLESLADRAIAADVAYASGQSKEAKAAGKDSK